MNLTAGKFKKAGLIAGVALLFLGAGLTFAFKFGSHSLKSSGLWKEAHLDAHSSMSVGNIFAVYRRAFWSLQEKVDDLRRADQDRERLKLENAYLRLRLESEQFEHQADDASHATQEKEAKLKSETGSKIGRTLASIRYRVPENLLPGQLYTLGVKYFQAHEDEKSAALFSFLTHLEDNDTYRTPQAYLMAAISWYRLDNLNFADQYLDQLFQVQALTSEAEPANGILSQARLWKALVAQRMGKHHLAQEELKKLIEQYPHSMEAKWVNSGSGTSFLPDTEANREPAKSKAPSEPHAKD